MRDNESLSDLAAEEIRAQLGRRNMNKSELARKLGVSHTWVTNRLTGAQEIGLNDLEQIAAALGVSVMDLIPAQRAGSATVGYRGVPVMSDARHRRTAPITDPLCELVLPRHRAFSPFEIAGPAW